MLFSDFPKQISGRQYLVSFNLSTFANWFIHSKSKDRKCFLRLIQILCKLDCLTHPDIVGDLLSTWPVTDFHGFLAYLTLSLWSFIWFINSVAGKSYTMLDCFWPILRKPFFSTFRLLAMTAVTGPHDQFFWQFLHDKYIKSCRWHNKTFGYSSKFSTAVMTPDSRVTQKQGDVA